MGTAAEHRGRWPQGGVCRRNALPAEGKAGHSGSSEDRCGCRSGSKAARPGLPSREWEEGRVMIKESEIRGIRSDSDDYAAMW